MLAGGLAIGSVPATAQDEPSGKLTRMWKIVPKSGMENQFEEALKAHIEWRIQNNDPWEWNAYRQIAGEDMNAIFYRSHGHTWAEVDEYAESTFSEKADEHWNNTMSALVHHAVSYFDETNQEITNWPEDAEYHYFQVIDYHVKPGHTRQFESTASEIHKVLQDAKYPMPYSMHWSVTGPKLPNAFLVFPAEKLAGFDDPEKTVFEVVADTKGEQGAAELFESFGTNVLSQEGAIYKWDEEMSVRKD